MLLKDERSAHISCRLAAFFACKHCVAGFICAPSPSLPICAWDVPLRDCPPPSAPPLCRCEKQPNHSRASKAEVSEGRSKYDALNRIKAASVSRETCVFCRQATSLLRCDLGISRSEIKGEARAQRQPEDIRGGGCPNHSVANSQPLLASDESKESKESQT